MPQQIAIDPVVEGQRAKTELHLALWRFSRELGAIDFTYLELTEDEREDVTIQWNALLRSIRRALGVP